MLPTIMGKMPYMSLPGFQVVPSRNSGMPIWNIAGSPLAKRNTHIRATAKIEIAAARVNSTLAKPSFLADFDI